MLAPALRRGSLTLSRSGEPRRAYAQVAECVAACSVAHTRAITAAAMRRMPPEDCLWAKSWKGRGPDPSSPSVDISQMPGFRRTTGLGLRAVLTVGRAGIATGKGRAVGSLYKASWSGKLRVFIDRWLHDLRHTAGTLALRQGVPLHTVSKMLGHSDPAMILRRYAHVLEDMREDAARAMDNLF